jgi:hypothetical protein
MTLQVGILCIIYVLVGVAAQMTCQVLPVYMLDKSRIIEQELLAEVTVWMRHDLSVPFVTNVTIFDVGTELLDVIQSLLPDEDGSALEADFAECLLVCAF